MRMPDMRLIVFITLIVLSAAMPANCAEEPPIQARSSIGRPLHASAPADRGDHSRGLLQLTIQDTPKRSFSIPNRSAQKVSPIGITTLPPSASAP